MKPVFFPNVYRFITLWQELCIVQQFRVLNDFCQRFVYTFRILVYNLNDFRKEHYNSIIMFCLIQLACSVLRTSICNNSTRVILGSKNKLFQIENMQRSLFSYFLLQRIENKEMKRNYLLQYNVNTIQIDCTEQTIIIYIYEYIFYKYIAAGAQLQFNYIYFKKTYIRFIYIQVLGQSKTIIVLSCFFFNAIVNLIYFIVAVSFLSSVE